MRNRKNEIQKVSLKCFLCFFSLLFLFYFSPACGTQDFESKVDEYINAYLKLGKFSGSVLIAQKGEVLVSKGYGMANYEHDVPHTPRTKFRIGSMTKQFTAMAIMQLQERGKLNVKDFISNYMDIPDIWNDITLHHLLTHTSGIPLYYNYPEYASYSRGPISPKELVETVVDKPLNFPPGEGCSISCSGFNILGYIIEIVSGMSYADFLRENIFKPLDMKDSGFDLPSPILKNRASGYYRKANGELANAGYIHMTAPYAAGALYSTVEDLYKWDRALYTEKLATKQTLDTIFTPFSYDSKYEANYGYGWWMMEHNNRKMVGHAGGVNGFTTNIARYTDDDVCVIVLSNLGGTWPTIAKISNDLTAMVFGEEYEFPKEEKKPEIVEVDPKIYDAYVGQYEFSEYILFITKRDDRLFFQASWRPELEIFPISEKDFALNGEQIAFIKNEQGEVTHLIYHVGGTKTPCKKIK